MNIVKLKKYFLLLCFTSFCSFISVEILHEYFNILYFYLRRVTQERCITSHFRLMVHLQPHGMILLTNYKDSVHLACLFAMQYGSNNNHGQISTRGAF